MTLQPAEQTWFFEVEDIEWPIGPCLTVMPHICSEDLKDYNAEFEEALQATSANETSVLRKKKNARLRQFHVAHRQFLPRK